MKALIALTLAGGLSLADAAPLILDSGFHHLRNAEPREWSHFPEKAGATRFETSFDVEEPASIKLLTLRQADIKQGWDVVLNGRKLGSLDRDDNDLELALPVPQKLLKREGNKLEIATRSEEPDDIRVGQVALHDCARADVATGAQLSVRAIDTDSNPLPCRITIVDADTNSLVLVGTKSDDRLAVRPGVIYSLDGLADFGMRPGRYRIWVGRGFEYSLVEHEFELKKGENRTITVELRHEVKTPGLVACDTHLHTNEFARHGDATLIERLITIAGEGIELPISTELDQHIDYAPEARRIGADKHYTPVVGCEVTTKLGHFNSFPIDAGSKPAQHRLRPWPGIFRSIYGTPGVKVVIINHPRDVHGGFTPLAPAQFDADAGRFTDGHELKANGIEVINSGAQQSDPMLLVHDWMALLKSGHKIAAVGSSDSHTVNFAIAGQARTYIACDDDDPARIDISAAADAFIAGKTHVSFGLLTLLEKKGDRVVAKVHGPAWTQATRLTLYGDGEEIAAFDIPKADGTKIGLKFEHSWPLGELADRTFLVAVATGPGISAPYWRMMPPYQADTPEYKPYVMGISPAVWIGE